MKISTRSRRIRLSLWCLSEDRHSGHVCAWFETAANGRRSLHLDPQRTDSSGARRAATSGPAGDGSRVLERRANPRNGRGITLWPPGPRRRVGKPGTERSANKRSMIALYKRATSSAICSLRENPGGFRSPVVASGAINRRKIYENSHRMFAEVPVATLFLLVTAYPSIN